MLNDVVKDIVQAVKQNVESGMQALAEKLEPRIKALEEKPEAKEGVSRETVEQLIQESLKSIEKPKDGEPGTSVTIEDVKPLIDRAVLEAVEGIQIPEVKDGEPGKDALELEILPSLDEAKSYPRGVYAMHNGGVFRSYEKTQGMRGWECILEGIKDIDISYDGERGITVKCEKSGGAVVEKSFTMPNQINKGVWRPGEYKKHDTVCWSGSTWIALEDTKDAPGDVSKHWIIMAKQGGTGKSAYDIARAAGFEGTRQEWLDSLGKKQTVKI